MAGKKVNRPSADLAKLNKDRLRILLAHGYKGIKVDGSWGPYQLKLWDNYTSTNEGFKRALLHNDMQIKYWDALNKGSDARIALWDTYPQYRLPFILDKAVTLKGVNPRYRGATFSTNMLDSLYKDVNYNKKDFDTALALFGNETMFGRGRMRFKNYDVLPYLTEDNSTSNWQGITETEAVSNWQLLMGDTGVNSLYDNIDKILGHFNSNLVKDSPELSIPTQPLTKLDSITLLKGIDILSRQNSYMKEHPLTESPIKNLVDLYNKNPKLLNPGALNYVPLIEKTKQELNLEPAIIEWKRRNFKSDGGFMFEEDPPVKPEFPDNPTNERVLSFREEMEEYLRKKSLQHKIENLKLPNGEDLQRFAGETQEDYENRYKERVNLYNLRKAEADKRFEARQQKINNIVKDITDTVGLAVETPSMPFSGEDYREAAEYERQKLVNKAHDYKNIFDATITAAELGMSGASLLGAYANWKKWKDLASLANPTTAQLAKARIANLLLKALLPMLIGGTGIDAYLTYDALNNDDTPNTIYNGISMGLGALGSVGASDVFLNSRFHSPKIDRILDVLGITLNTGDFLKLGYDTYNSITKDDNKKATGGSLSTPLDWNELSMKEKAQYIRMGVSNGYKDIESIKSVYNEFKNGGIIYKKGGKKLSYTNSQVVLKALKYFMDKGLTDYQAAGLVGNLVRESGLNTNALNKSSGAFGIALWLGPRKKALLSRYGDNPTLDLLLNYVWLELNTTHRKGLNNILASKSAEEAARNAMGYYEFSVGPEGAIRDMYRHRQNGQFAMDEGIRHAGNIMKSINPNYVSSYVPEYAKSLFVYDGPTEYDKSFYVDDNTLNAIIASLNTPKVNNIALDTHSLTGTTLPEVVVTPEQLPVYTLFNPSLLLDLMNDMMVAYKAPDPSEITTATKILALSLLNNQPTLLDKDLENSIMRANRLGTLEQDELLNYLKNVEWRNFLSNMSANGGKLYGLGGDEEEKPTVYYKNHWTGNTEHVTYNDWDEALRVANFWRIMGYSPYGKTVLNVLPEAIVTGYSPIELQTYYPIVNKEYPFTGHSLLKVPLTNAVADEYNLRSNDEVRNNASTSLWVDKLSDSTDYNLITNNCADATLGYLNKMFGTNEKPLMFTTPGDVRDFAIKHLKGKVVNRDGVDTVLIPRNEANADALSRAALDKYLTNTDENTAFVAPEYSLGGPLVEAANMFEDGGRALYTNYDNPLDEVVVTAPRKRNILKEWWDDITSYDFVKDFTNWFKKDTTDVGHMVEDLRSFGIIPGEGKTKDSYGSTYSWGIAPVPDGEISVVKKPALNGIDISLFSSPEKTGVSSKVITDPNDVNFVLKLSKKGYTLEELNDILAKNELLNKYTFIQPTEYVESTVGADGKYYPIWRQGKVTPYGREAIFGADGKLLPEAEREAARAKSNEAVQGILKEAQKQGLYILDGRILTPDGLIQDFGEFHNVGFTADGRPVIFDAQLALNPKSRIGGSVPQITAENAVSITPEQWTAAQDAAIARGDIAEAQRLRDLHFKVSAPNTQIKDIQYHGAKGNTKFNVFDPKLIGQTDKGWAGRGYYFTPSIDYAKMYGSEPRAFYINAQNVHDGTAATYFGRENGPEASVFKIIRKRHGNDGQQILDELASSDAIRTSFPQTQPYNGRFEEVVTRNNNQMKLADAVTYDKKGVRIPLGKRDNFNINDIRYSWLPWLLGGTTAGYLLGKTQQ